MNPNQPGVSFGSGGPLLGAPASSVMGMPGGLQQQTPSSPSFEPGLLPPPPGQAPQAPTMAQVPGSTPTPPQMPPPMQTAPQQGVVGIPPGNPEAIMIIKTLSSRLAHINKGEEMQRNGVV